MVYVLFKQVKHYNHNKEMKKDGEAVDVTLSRVQNMVERQNATQGKATEKRSKKNEGRFLNLMIRNIRENLK